ncbi:hypothetical protein CHARACLAT_008387 [Characodon lateralis]|uniref:Uncharacterized protein n=1 Tax=Characodon lateralis TaxID=208331 RepID=A0ABU7EIV0_9TELE|nr:hypothetical protein [Characodon lateralis]
MRATVFKKRTTIPEKPLTGSDIISFWRGSTVEQELPPMNVVKGTMRIHQVISSCKDKIHYRDITCVCQRDEGLTNCPCFDVKEAILQLDEETHRKGAITAWQPEVVTGDHLGRWCVVKYDHDYYPGIITTVEDGNTEVNCLHNKGIESTNTTGPAQGKTSVGMMTARYFA